RMAENSLVWSPATSCALGYTRRVMRPSERSLTRSAHFCAARPQGKASDSTVETEYSRACAVAHRAVSAAPAASAEKSRLSFIGASLYGSWSLSLWHRQSGADPAASGWLAWRAWSAREGTRQVSRLPGRPCGRSAGAGGLRAAAQLFQKRAANAIV